MRKHDNTQSVFIVVAAYNESTVLGEVLEELCANYPNAVVVDDGSTDRTAEVARKYTSHVLRHAVNRGQGAALQTGITYALMRNAEFIVTFDADGQHRVQDIASLLQSLRGGEFDIALGSRFLDKKSDMPTTRRWLLKGAVLFTRIFNRMHLSDAHNGLRAFTARAARMIDIRMDRMAHASELIDQIRHSQLPFIEVPVKIRYTEYSLTKHRSLRDAFRISFHYLVGRISR
ncbi:MAG: glycosyltransferase family 2 protein [Planctomycetota bacterium]|jgi:glycosyltransferase involved in cell wall biosynthesis